MPQSHKTTVLLIIVLSASHLLWGLMYRAQYQALSETRVALARVVQNKKIASFQKLFIEKVLRTDGVVDFTTRVQLQNAVTDIHDEAITEAWDAFLSAQTEIEGQEHVKMLLFLLAEKVYEDRTSMSP